jgi:hypothetical protein
VITSGAKLFSKLWALDMTLQLIRLFNTMPMISVGGFFNVAARDQLKPLDISSW